MLTETKVVVKAPETIAHDDEVAICTKPGWKRWKTLCASLRRLKRIYGDYDQSNALEMSYGPYIYEDNRTAKDA